MAETNEKGNAPENNIASEDAKTIEKIKKYKASLPRRIWCRCFQCVLYVAEYFLPWRVPEQISGEGSLAKLPAFAKEKGFKSALLVTDSGLMSLGMAQPIIDGFNAEGLKITVYDKVVPNPTIGNIEDGVKLYKDNNCDVIIALGGGSPMDCAKGIGARIARPGKTIAKMKGVLRVLRKLPPLVAIPTTSGTGSEATLAAVISNPEKRRNIPSTIPCSSRITRSWTPLSPSGCPSTSLPPRVWTRSPTPSRRSSAARTPARPNSMPSRRLSSSSSI